MRSCWSLLFSKLSKPTSLLSSKESYSIPQPSSCPSFGPASTNPCSSCVGGSHWCGLQLWGLTRVEQRCRIPSLTLLARLLSKQPRTGLFFWTESAHCQLMCSFSTTSTPNPFHQGCSQSLHPQPEPFSEP